MATKIGGLQFVFISMQEAKIIDTVVSPELLKTDCEITCAKGFSFFLTARLLHNLPNQFAIDTLRESLEKLHGPPDPGVPQDGGRSLLGLFTKKEITLLPKAPCGGRWVYSSSMVIRDSGPEMKLKHTKGGEEYFHRAAMALSLEHLRIKYRSGFKMEEKRTAADESIGQTIASFLEELADSGLTEIEQSYEIAAAAARYRH